MPYTIWCEFEAYDPPEAADADGYGNVIVTYPDGRSAGFNVWTVDLFRRRVQELLEEAERDGFAELPDLLVTRLDREHVTAALKRILPEG